MVFFGSPGIMKQLKKIRPSKFPELEKRLYEWFKEEIARKSQLTNEIFRSQAVEISKELSPNEEFSVSAGWLNSFKKRHGIKAKKLSGEKASADVTAATQFLTRFHDKVLEQNLSYN